MSPRDRPYPYSGNQPQAQEPREFRVSDRPPGACRRQKNLLVRVVLRYLAKTLTNDTANALGERDR
jgi:hypothetical protein